ncbi:MAG: circularly permuted type 2 ATP-grasp protein [Acidimicrobiales bacterium]
MSGELFDGYDHGGFFDEVFDGTGDVRLHYHALMQRLAELSPDDLRRRERLRDEAFRTAGITFTVYGDEGGIERTFPMDLLPRIIPADEWAMIDAGLSQRVTVLNRFLDDLYVGERAVLHDGIVPRWLITSSSGFRREAAGVPVPNGARCLVAGIDLVRDAGGTYRVLEDNLRNPSGISYVLENRASMTRVLPGAFTDHSVRSVDHYGNALLQALGNVAPAAAGDNPTIVVLTPGVHNSAYFEHAFLARQMGVELVEGRDLVVDEHVVSMRTTRGLQRVDVIYRRIDDDFLDPVVFRPDSALGVPGLMGAARGGNVTIANAVGNGVADDKAVYAYVPDLIRYYLGEEPKLANVDTYLLWDPDQRAAVLERLDQLVIKPVAESGGYGMLIGPAASDEEIELFRQRIETDPRGYIAQEVVALSRHPTLVDDHLEGRHIDLRPFVLSGDGIEVIPGGLTRVALRKGSLVVNSSQGGGSKDTWVLAPEEVGAADRAARVESADVEAGERVPS